MITEELEALAGWNSNAPVKHGVVNPVIMA
jgi:hypothetical protein